MPKNPAKTPRKKPRKPPHKTSHKKTHKKIHRIGLREEQTLLIKEQVVLSKERTVLSFMRTGLAAMGAGIVLINVFPDNYTTWVVGWALILIGVVEVVESYRRLKHYKDRLNKIKSRLGKEWV